MLELVETVDSASLSQPCHDGKRWYQTIGGHPYSRQCQMPPEPYNSLVSGRRHVLAFLLFRPFLGAVCCDLKVSLPLVDSGDLLARLIVLPHLFLSPRLH